MLVELQITNFAIIDRLNLHFVPGFNALTGETGAGKSIIIDAMSAMLGERIGPEFVRHGTSQARVEGQFELTYDPGDEKNERMHRLVSVMVEQELLDEDSQRDGKLYLTLAREINISGRSTCRVNGSTVKQDILREIGDALVDIHGQTEHISLFRVSEHLELLDQYAGVIGRRNQLSDLVGTLRAVRKEMTSLREDERELARRSELLKFQVEEINAASLQVGEEDELVKERQLQNNSEKLSSVADNAYRILYQGYDEEDSEGYSRAGRRRAPQAVQQALTEVESLLTELAKLEPEMAQHIEIVQEANIKLEDVSHAVREFRDRMEFDPARLDEVEERLETIRSLKRKYGTDIKEILAFRDRSAAELDKIEHSEERLLELAERENGLLDKIGKISSELAVARRKAGDKLAGEVEQSLRDLRLMRARFEVVITQQADDKAGAPANLPDGSRGRYAFDGRGIDRVEFYVSLNPGEPPKPLQKVASGGETSRLMLALKSILASADTTPTLIFDEVDVGVGGRSGQVVGEKLWQLTNHGDHQVLCITHLPQIAAFGDAHFNIVKSVTGERTATNVRQLDEPEKVDEIAAMLGGTPVTDAMRVGAEELLKDVRGWKEAARNGTLDQYASV